MTSRQRGKTPSMVHYDIGTIATIVGKLTTKAQRKSVVTPLFQRPALYPRQATPIVCKKKVSGCSTAPALEPADPDTAGPLGHDGPATAATAKPKERQHPRETREQRRVKKDRRSNFMQAVAFAFARDWPINVAITVGWVVLIHAGAHNEGHCLGLDEAGRDERLRAELCRSRPVTADKAPFVALWTRATARHVGHHTHLGLFWPPRVGSLEKLVALLERLTGSPAAPTDTLKDPNVLAQSVCKGWQIKRIYGKTQLIGALNWIEYMLQHADKHLEVPQGKTFGLSQAIGPKARAAFRPNG